jgi:hypothetical protein
VTALVKPKLQYSTPRCGCGWSGPERGFRDYLDASNYAAVEHDEHVAKDCPGRGAK